MRNDVLAYSYSTVLYGANYATRNLNIEIFAQSCDFKMCIY